MSRKTIVIIDFSQYDGKHISTDHMYFETELGAERYLKGNGYEPDDIFGWKKDYFYTAKIRFESLHLGDGEEWYIINTNTDELKGENTN